MKRVSQNAEALRYVDKATQTPTCAEAQTQTPWEWEMDGTVEQVRKICVDVWVADYVKKNGVRPTFKHFKEFWVSLTGERPDKATCYLSWISGQECRGRKRPLREEAAPNGGANGTSDMCQPGSDDEEEGDNPQQKRPKGKAGTSPHEALQEWGHWPERTADQGRPALGLPGRDNPAQVLLVFDLNGVLCDRARHFNAPRHLLDNADYREGPIVARKRPFLHDLLEFLKANRTHFQAIVWSSAPSKNVRAMCDQYFRPGLFAEVMGREDCHKYWLGPEEQAKALAQSPEGADVAGVPYELTCKDLAVIWDLGIGWNAQNTLLVDDDPQKASLHPLNAIHPYSFDATICKDEYEYNTDCELPRLIEYLGGCKGVKDIQKHVDEVK
eukprot:CAMPEP_0174300782 /NCGR_PEP_ID=MMETSP0809-20121228/58665_1 /TAXON_ID=73025 ORGANISM="Eutreptiella gymnastica-like, Strain CCMP1594" /NCGR_SAMPLE_ID=MMETSP0809 /ASSEMBLY_ACC=CAM_ASM_000658 /LENGTH=383 /DNA_ID=CAMNT_0015406419 /DNA_START=17 /DNA_END=1168 /DNA_ORIENTATION=+